VSPINDWTAKDRRIAIWSAVGTFFFGLLYAPTLVAAGNVKETLDGPVLGNLGGTDRPDGPLVVVMMVAVHGYSPRRQDV
jgi:hypothetical protein